MFFRDIVGIFLHFARGWAFLRILSPIMTRHDPHPLKKTPVAVFAFPIFTMSSYMHRRIYLSRLWLTRPLAHYSQPRSCQCFAFVRCNNPLHRHFAPSQLGP